MEVNKKQLADIFGASIRTIQNWQEAQIASISQSVARFSSASGVEVDKVAEAFGKLTTEGNTNISGVTVVFRAGEQEQTPPEGFESSGSETVLGTEVKYDTPITRTITSANIDRLRFTFGVQALVETTSKGDRNPSEVRLLVQIQRNGGWVTEKDITIKGKTTSQYLASVVVDNLPPRPFNIRMRRMTPDSTTDQLQNKTLWSSYTEIIDVKQCYPNTALVGVQVDSEQFGSQQVSRNYHLRGRILQVPSNYNPQTRQYSGIWDGTFKPAYSNNMAWCLWDMLTHPRYGMGKRLGAADVDKWALYVIGQYCDQSVPDGFGGTEPRITCNAYLTTQRKAWDVLSDFCSAMRCMPVWNGQTLTFVQDRPSDKVWTYNRSNVVMPDDGAPFRYSFSALKDRHNAVEVNWIDPNNGWETATELVEDTQAIARYGRNVTKMDAFGCTSRGQAHRAGLWLIKTELLETQTVDFSVGAEGLRHVPGDVIEICDDDYAGISIGGRVLAVNSQTRTLTLDREITLPSSGTTLISLVDGQGSPVSVEVQSVTDGVKVKVSRVPDGVAEYSVWGLKLPTLRQRLFRCVSIRENDDGTYAITAVQHLTAEVTADSGEYQVLARWDTPKVVKGVSFMLRLTVAADEGIERLVSTARTAETTYRFTQLALGNYRLTVRAVNARGQQGDPASVSFRIAAPAAPSRIELTPGYFQITATPHLAVYDPTVQFEFWFSEKRIADIRQVETTARYLGTALYWIAASINIKPGHDYYFYIRSVNTVGKSAFVEAVGRASDDAEGYLDFFKGKIFSLTSDGKLTAKNADISGSVNANSGTLNNVTINENCQIKGKLSANQIEGDIVKTVSKSFPRTNSYASGTITVRISDDQKFDRQVMIPPVLFRGGKHENFNSNNQQSYWYSTCRLRVTRNGQEIFNQSTTDAQGVFSSVIDMPAGQGTLTLTFTVSSSGANNWTPTTSISDLLVVVMKKSTAGISIS
ncbi:host specificity protein J [Escherichia coli]